jgi:hypothetical protein
MPQANTLVGPLFNTQNDIDFGPEFEGVGDPLEASFGEGVTIRVAGIVLAALFVLFLLHVGGFQTIIGAQFAVKKG